VKQTLLRLKEQIARDRLSIVSAGVAFYMLLAVFPLLGALVSVYGLIFDPQHVTAQLAALEGVVPEQAMNVLLGQFQSLKQAGSAALGVGLVVSLVLALWSASAGVKAMMEALNVAYDEREKRGFVRRSAVALLLTVGAIAGAIVAIGIVVVLPTGVRFLGLSGVLGGLIAYARWPILALGAVLAFSVLYRYGPSREEAKHTAWINRGAVIATALWLAGSILFSWYVSNFGKYNETYGAVAAVVILLMWLLLSAYALLIGAEINADYARAQRTRSASTDARKSERRRARSDDALGLSPR
jgi:membrane protein